MYESGYSDTALVVAKIFVEQSRKGILGDPQLSPEELQKITGLSKVEMEDALYELSLYLDVNHYRILPKNSLFAEFDKYWKVWNPEEDALKLAADMVNDENFPALTTEIATLYGWEARRMNPAVTYLIDYGAIKELKTMSSTKIYSTPATRHFVKTHG